MSPDEPDFAIPATNRSDLRIICFAISLPLPLPLPERWSFSLHGTDPIPVLSGVHMVPDDPRPVPPEWDARMFTFFRFHRVLVPPLKHRAEMNSARQLLNAIVGRDHELGEPTEPDAVTSWAINMHTPRNAQPSDRPIEEALHRCLEDLRSIVEALRLAIPVPVPLLRAETLAPKAPYAIRGVDGYDWEAPSWVAVNTSIAEAQPDVPVLTHKGLGQMQHWLRLRTLKHPMAVVNHHSANAAAALFAQGEPADAIVQAAIAAEALLDGTLLMLLWEEQASPAEVARVFDSTIAQRLRRHFHGRLRGSWHQNGVGAIGRWRERIADLRNAIVHAAYEPSRAEALEALLASRALYEFIATRLRQVVDNYPQTTALMYSVEDAMALAERSSALKTVMDQMNSGQVQFLRNFNQWRETIPAA